MRAAASRTFWTAGNKRPMRIAMIAITTNNSIKVNAERGRGIERPSGGMAGQDHHDTCPKDKMLSEPLPRASGKSAGGERLRSAAGTFTLGVSLPHTL